MCTSGTCPHTEHDWMLSIGRPLTSKKSPKRDLSGHQTGYLHRYEQWSSSRAVTVCTPLGACKPARPFPDVALWQGYLRISHVLRNRSCHQQHNDRTEVLPLLLEGVSVQLLYPLILILPEVHYALSKPYDFLPYRRCNHIEGCVICIPNTKPPISISPKLLLALLIERQVLANQV